MGIVTTVLLGHCAARWLGVLAYRTAPTRSDEQGPEATTGTVEDTGPTVEGVGTVVCCSGGGIKSASFTLGVLQYLRGADSKLPFDQVSHLVGVSGGGYMAAAMIAAMHRSATPADAFMPGSKEERDFRRRTDYLTADSAARLSLGLWMFFGILVNVVFIGGIAIGIGWLAARHAVETYPTIVVAGPSVPEGWRGWVVRQLVPSAALLLLLALVFLTRRNRLGQRVATWITTRRAGEPAATVPSLARAWLDRLPVVLLGSSLLLAALSPGVIAVTWCALEVGSHLPHAVGTVLTEIRKPDFDAARWVGGAMTVAGVLWKLARSTVRGAQRNDQASTLLTFARRRLAPVTGVTVVVLSALTVACVYVDHVISAGRPATAQVDWLGWRTLGIIAALALVWFLFGAANVTSMFPFYRRRLVTGYLGGRPGPPLATLTGGATGRRDSIPALCLSATANVTGSGQGPVGRGGQPFLFGSRIGFSDSILPAGGAEDVESYRTEGRSVDVATAMALSGAAIAPVAGRETRLIGPARLLLALLNVRLGQWVANPYWRTAPEPRSKILRPIVWLNRAMNQPSPGHVVQEAFAELRWEAPYVYVTDGGHYDNLGLVEALRMKPKRVIVIDGSGDTPDEFPTMGRAIATARMDLGVEVYGFNPYSMRRRGRKRTKNPHVAWTRAQAGWHDGTHSCTVDYLKCVLVDGLPWDLRAYALTHPGFPEQTEGLETFDEFGFEAFRQLGYSLAERAADPSTGWASTTPEGRRG